jgi:hypothetical protein
MIGVWFRGCEYGMRLAQRLRASEQVGSEIVSMGGGSFRGCEHGRRST